MQTYRSHKTVQATRIQAVSEGIGSIVLSYQDGQGETILDTDIMIARYRPKVGDYLVVYADGYRSFSPAKAFEDGYLPVNSVGMDFGEAIRALKCGKRVARAGWNGKDMFLFLVHGSRFKVSRPPLLGIYPEGHEVDYHAHVDMKTAQGYVVPWLCSQADMLANDWMLV